MGQPAAYLPDTLRIEDPMTDLRLMNDIFVICEIRSDSAEVEISGSPNAMAAFGHFLRNITASCHLEVPTCDPSPYPLSLPRIAVEIAQDDTGRLTASVDQMALTISGAREVIANLGRSLQGFSDENTKAGTHFHLDHFDGSLNRSEMDCGLIFAVRPRPIERSN